MTTEDAALRITHHIRAGLQFTANKSEVERGAHFENLILDVLQSNGREVMRGLLQLHLAHATSAEIHWAVQNMFMVVIEHVAQMETICLLNKP